MKNKIICLAFLVIAVVIALYLGNKSCNESIYQYELDSMRQQTKMDTLYAIMIDGNMTKEELIDTLLLGSASHLEFLNKCKYDLDYYCEFWNINQIKTREKIRNNIKKFDDLSLYNKLDSLCAKPPN